MIITKIKGGLGNQLFQYAAALNISQTFNQPVLLDTSFYNEEKFEGLFRLDKFKIAFKEVKQTFDISNKNKISNKFKKYLFRNTSFFPYSGCNVINGDSLKYPLKSLSKLNKNEIYLLDGWLQKRIYFSPVSELLVDQFWLKENELTDKKLIDMISTKKSVAVHVRCGDMANNLNFAILEKKYYVQGIIKILNLIDNPHFFIFSDEPIKAMDLFQDLNVPMTFIKEHSKSMGAYGTKGDYIDFELMRMCKHFIIANSTFSWWPAYLSNNSNKTVCAPLIWFKNKMLQTNFEKTELLQNNWIVI